MGADLTINSRNEDAAKVIQEKTGGAHAAVVTAVAKAAFNSAVDAVRAGGRVVAVGLPPEAMSLDIPRLVLDGIEVWCDTWWSTAGRSACTPPTMNLSAACWTCLRR